MRRASSAGASVTRADLVRFTLLGVIWGSSFLFIAVALEGLTPAQIVLGRMVVGSLVLAGVCVSRRLRLPRSPALWGHLGVMAVIANLVPFTLWGFAEQRIASGTAGVLNATTPLFTLLLVATLQGTGRGTERIGAVQALGLGLGFVGVVVVVGPWQAGALEGSVAGGLAGLAAAACYGVSFVYTRAFVATSGEAPLALSTVQLGIGALLMLVATPALGPRPVTLDPVVVLSVLALGALGTGLAYQLYFRLLASVGATTASTVTYVIPLVAVGLGWLVLGEPLRWNLFAGGLVVVAGVALAEGRLRPVHSRRPSPPGAGAAPVTSAEGPPRPR